jgi:hypothetical protein
MKTTALPEVDVVARFRGALYGFVVSDAQATPFKWHKPEEVAHLRLEGVYFDRPGNALMPHLPAAYTTRDTEALIAVLKSSTPLPDLLHFAFNLKAAFTTFPEKWRVGTVFPWPPFPDKSHFTLAFALPAAYRYASGMIGADQLTAWIQRLSPASVIWQQCIYVYTTLLAGLMSGRIDATGAWAEADRLVEAAESMFPGAALLDPFLNSLETVSDYKTDPRLEEGIPEHAHTALSLAIHAFSKGASTLPEMLQPVVSLGGDTGAACYAGALWGAAHGFEAVPTALVSPLQDSVRLEAGFRHVVENKNV